MCVLQQEAKNQRPNTNDNQQQNLWRQRWWDQDHLRWYGCSLRPWPHQQRRCGHNQPTHKSDGLTREGPSTTATYILVRGGEGPED